jgi:hypothetical protein
MGVRFVDPLRRDHADRVRRFVDEALRELDTDLDVPLRLRDRHAPADGTGLAPGVHAVAGRDGVVLSRDLLERADEDLRAILHHETAHLWQLRANPRVAASDLHAELFAVWFTGRACGIVYPPSTIDTETNRRHLGRACGAALAGHTETHDMLAAADYDDLVRLVARLDGDADPPELARQLVAELGGR